MLDNVPEGPKPTGNSSCVGIAQLVEQLICNQQVVGSNPTAGYSDIVLCAICKQ
jgi:hypothetical protein